MRRVRYESTGGPLLLEEAPVPEPGPGGLLALGALAAAHPEPGETALVTAAASGVGHLAVQLAKVRGAARVVGAVSDAGKADFVRSLGADDVVTYSDDRWGDPVDYAL